MCVDAFASWRARRSVLRSTRAFKCSSFGRVSGALGFYRARSCFISLTLSFTLMLVETFDASTAFHFCGASKCSLFRERSRRLTDASKCSRARRSVRRSTRAFKCSSFGRVSNALRFYRSRSGFISLTLVITLMLVETFGASTEFHFRVRRSVCRFARALIVCQIRRSVRLLAIASKCSSSESRV